MESVLSTKLEYCRKGTEKWQKVNVEIFKTLIKETNFKAYQFDYHFKVKSQTIISYCIIGLIDV